MRAPDLPVLTSLRFPAAAAIVLFHSLYPFQLGHGVWDALASGVSFFYVLSGFILYYNYRDLTDRHAFWAARVARIWPVHVVTFILTLLLVPSTAIWGLRLWPLTAPLNLALLHAWVPWMGVVFSFNGVSWSLSVEAFFYLMFPWLLVFLKRRGPVPFLAATFLLGLGLVTGCALLDPPVGDIVGRFNPLCRVFEFALGMAAAEFWLRERRAVVAGTGWEIAALVLAVGTEAGLIAFLTHAALDVAVINWLANTVGAISFAFVIWVFAHQAGALSRWASGPLPVRLGEISFALFMCHQILLRWIVYDRANVGVRLAVATALTLLLSYALFRWVETPCRRWIIARDRRWRTQGVAETAAAVRREP